MYGKRRKRSQRRRSRNRLAAKTERGSKDPTPIMTFRTATLFGQSREMNAMAATPTMEKRNIMSAEAAP